MIIPLVIVIILGIVYIIPRKADKNEKIANTRIEDRFSSNIRVLDTSIKHANRIRQCSTRRIHPANNSRNVKANLKDGLPMNKVSALRIKHTKDMRTLASLKAEHAAKNSQREIALRIRVGLFIGSVLFAFAMLGIYFASVITIFWVLIPAFVALLLGFYMQYKGNKDKQKFLNEKNKIAILQKRIKHSSQSRIFSQYSSANKPVNALANNISSYEETSVDSSIKSDIDIEDNFSQFDENIEAVVDEKLDQSSRLEKASKWTATRIPTPLYARINAEQSIQSLLSTKDNDKDNDSVNELSIETEETPEFYRPTTAKPIQNAVTADELVDKEVRFDLENVLRSRTAG